MGRRLRRNQPFVGSSECTIPFQKEPQRGHLPSLRWKRRRNEAGNLSYSQKNNETISWVLCICMLLSQGY